MRVLILGADGYIGWALAQHLVAHGYTVDGLDNCWRRETANSLIVIDSFETRQEWFRSKGGTLHLGCGVLRAVPPEPWDTIINLAQQPSAPYSMQSVEACRHTWLNTSQVNTLLWQIKESYPDAHLIHIGSMGEYGTPSCNISEGDFNYADDEGNEAQLMFPRRPSSIYHAAKVASTFMIEGCCRWWGLRATDIMQGVVFGTAPGYHYPTRLDADELFGTVVHRFCAQVAADLPLTVYGTGTQKRSFLTLGESLECIRLILANPPEAGEYRTVNQFAQIYSMMELAEIVAVESRNFYLTPVVALVDNPRVEAADHYYQPESKFLAAHGFEPKRKSQHMAEIRGLIGALIDSSARTKLLMKDQLLTQWK